MGTDKARVLIIEDEALVARELQSRLTNMGYTVVGIANAPEPAIAMARDTRPDLLLTDINLKDGGDGIDTATLIQQERYVPVVFLTAYSDQETVRRARSASPYGYIIKPVDNRELEIALDIALYKASLERELRETKELLQTALDCIGNCLIFVDREGNVRRCNEAAEQLLGIDDAVAGKPWQEVVQPGEGLGQRIENAMLSGALERLAPFVIKKAKGHCLVEGVIGPLQDGQVLILRELSDIDDQVETLPSPEELLARLAPDRISPDHSFFVQILLSPDHLGEITLNTVDRESVLREIEVVLNQFLRATDLTSRYSEQVIAVSLPYTSLREGEHIANLILKDLSTCRFLDNRIRLSFSAGLADSGPGDQQPFELFRRASWALNIAREAGGSRVIVWRPESEHGAMDEVQPEIGKTYRNLLLLWNLMNIVGPAKSLPEILFKTAAHLLSSYKLENMALLGSQDDALIAYGGANRQEEAIKSPSQLALDADSFSQLQRALTESATEWMLIGNGRALPLRIEEQTLIMWFGEGAELDTEELAFLKSLVSYLATPIGSFLMVPSAAEEIEAAGEESTEIIHSTPRMIALMDQIGEVAKTDATVLLVGESGTGKELLARELHRHSTRKDKPFVIVDCGAVVPSLIESELFGHLRGSFTGADRDYTGRIKEADGGTLLLDEVGELPLEIQVKLLRFVQEQEFTPVGGNRYESVDTRIIAATNKNLRMLAETGQFREDLYYRLNVFEVMVPPLRERHEDVLPIATHYLARYAKQYHKHVTGFTSEAELTLQEYGWPGNIRELRNILQRAVILCKDQRISNIHLGIFSDEHNRMGRSTVDVLPGTELVDRLREQLTLFIRSALAANKYPPVGDWLEEDLMMAAMEQAAGVSSRAADMLGLPESTLRRKWLKLQKRDPGSRQRTGDWQRIKNLVPELLELGSAQLLDQIVTLLLQIASAEATNRNHGAQLLGVSLPTYRRMLASLN